MTDQFTPEQVEAVAKRLSEKQRQGMLWLPADGSWSETRAHWTVANAIIWLERHHPELAEAKIIGKNGIGNDLRHRLTPFGLAVRQYLQAPGTQPDSGAGPSPATRGSAPAVASTPARRKDS